MDKALSFLGLCRRAGKLLIGEDGVSGAARSGQAVLLMVAADTAVQIVVETHSDHIINGIRLAVKKKSNCSSLMFRH